MDSDLSCQVFSSRRQLHQRLRSQGSSAQGLHALRHRQSRQFKVFFLLPFKKRCMESVCAKRKRVKAGLGLFCVCSAGIEPRVFCMIDRSSTHCATLPAPALVLMKTRFQASRSFILQRFRWMSLPTQRAYRGMC